MSSDILFKFAIIAASGMGFYAARVISHHKTTGKILVCPLDSNCEAVVHSTYSKFLSIPLESLGSAYYALVGIAYLLEVISPDTLPMLVNQIIAGICISAFFFSLYLTGLQLFKIKEWCAWCLVSALMCLIIFLANIFLYGNTLILQPW